MRLMRNVLLATLWISLSALGCSTNESNSLNTAAYEMADMDAASVKSSQEASNGDIQNNVTLDERQLIKRGNMSFRVKNIQTAYQSLLSILKQHQAYISSEQEYTDDYRISFQIEIRVPKDQFDSLSQQIVLIADRLESRSMNVEDVTEQYLDLKTNIENKKVLEQRYEELLKQAKNINEILEIERSLNAVRTDIDNFTKQLDYLSKQVQYSTIQLNFYEELPYKGSQKGDNLLDNIKEALDTGWFVFTRFMLVLIGLWPFYLVGGLIFLLVRKLRKKKV